MSAQKIPLIHLRGTLIVSVQQEFSDSLVHRLKADLAREIAGHELTGLVIDVSGVDVVDSYIARALWDIAQVARLLGVQTAVAGVDAGMAMTLSEMGLSLKGVQTSLNLEAALTWLDQTGRAHDDAELLAELLGE
jgi:rsbT antagonist protein RsbS